MTNVRYRVLEPNIVSEIIDGEAIIMDLSSGDYFSTAGLGAEIWDRVQLGAARSDLMAASEAAGWGAEGVTGITAFLGDLVGHGLVAEDPTADETPSAGPAPFSGSYSAPQLERHDDMQDLIQLDPIHDVDEVGWPVRKADV